MVDWSNRPPEVRHLYNPSFCGVILREFVREYEKNKKTGVDFALIYLVLPILLHKHTKNRLPNASTTSMHSWIENNQDLIIRFPLHTKRLSSVTNETLLFLGKRGMIELKDCKIFNTKKRYSSSRESVNELIKEYILKARLISQWFSKVNSTSTIYHMWGIKP